MRVNEIFYSLQGEGFNTGRAAVFVRLSGCNLKCPFCDTDFSKYTEMSPEEIAEEVRRLSGDCKFVVITGGEPTLQDCEKLIRVLHEYDYRVAIETNGTRRAPLNANWVTVSPKIAYVGDSALLFDLKCDELKVVFDGEHEVSDYGVEAFYYYLQPCDTGDEAKNREIIDKCVEFIKKNPKWRLSLQTQKILNVR